jgi:Co/Zn/Cd efflux system component
MFVEFFRLTKSIWSVVILHMVEDSVINHLVIDGHIAIVAGKEFLISPIAGIITSTLYLGAGLFLRQKRIKKELQNAATTLQASGANCAFSSGQRQKIKLKEM